MTRVPVFTDPEPALVLEADLGEIAATLPKLTIADPAIFAIVTVPINAMLRTSFTSYLKEGVFVEKLSSH